MTRFLKTLGVAFFAALALSAVVASAASAQTNGKLTSTGPVTLHGTQTGTYGSGANAMTTFGNVVECEKAFYTGHKYNVTPHTLIPSGESTFTVTPHYGVCTTLSSGIRFTTTVDMNGCDYDFHLLETTPAGTSHTYGVRTFVTCPVGKHIQLTQFSSAANHTAGTSFCTTTIEENPAGYLGLHATDTTNGTIDISGTIKGIKKHRHSPTGSFLCPTATTEVGELHLDIAVTGKNASGQTTAISLSH
jgi:hypothetical protein